MKTHLFSIVIFFLINLWFINGIAIDDFHCKVPTCRDVHYGLKDLPQRSEYVEVCYDTVFSLQAIPTQHGKCINEKTGKLNPPCIYALAAVIKDCIDRMTELPKKNASFYCGYTLMKYCAVHLGLENFPLNFDF
ncbi:hypothetical protein I4U23_003373 [Adineta vaga]|nr:hypothetical protein I4U23_003373 [Adineta vaga]